jgi:hypothetical protein
MRKETFRAELIAAFVITLLFGLTSASTSLLFAAAAPSCEADPVRMNYVSALVSSPQGPVRVNIPLNALKTPGPVDLGAAVVQILFGEGSTAVQNPDHSVDAYVPERDCTLHLGCNDAGCPSIDSGPANPSGTFGTLRVAMPVPY